MDAKKIEEAKKVASKVGELLGGKFTSAGVFSTLVFLAIYFWEPISGFVKTAQDVNQQRKEMQELAKANKARIDSISRSVNAHINNDGEFTGMIIEDLTSIEKKQYETDRIIMEEMDRIDTLGHTFEMTSAGNLYYYYEGCFYSPRYDAKEREWYITLSSGRKYLR